MHFDSKDSFTQLSTRNYTVFVQDSSKCPATEKMVTVSTKECDCSEKIFALTAFSPNGDGNNDFFKVYTPLVNAKIENLQIFNRWGNLVFDSKDTDLSANNNWWQGTVNGKDAPVSVYIWILTLHFLDGTARICTGDVTLVR